MNKLDFMKKVFAILEKQQLVIKKLAAEKNDSIIEKIAQQNPNDKSDPFTYRTVSKDDPYYKDPMRLDEEFLTNPYKKDVKHDEKQKEPAKPKPNWLDKYMTNTESNKPFVANALPAELIKLLDGSSAKQFKNNLMLTVNGDQIKVIFNADRVKMTPQQVEDIIKASLPTYKIMDTVGEHNSNMKDWHPNY